MDRIEKSHARKGEYIGYGAGRVWCIYRSTSSYGNWCARPTDNDASLLFAFTLKDLDQKLKGLDDKVKESHL